jgi:hypothetical protein
MDETEIAVNERIEKWFMIFLFSLIVLMFIGAVLSADQRQTCRMELAKAGRTTEDIVKICP